MFFTIFLILVLVFGLIVLFWIFSKKLPNLRIMDPNTSSETHTKQLKYKIFRERVERAGGRQVETLKKYVLKPTGKGIQNFVRKVAGKLTSVERSYQERKHIGGESKMGKDELNALVTEGKKMMDEELWDRAEKKFIEVISNDPKCTDAYEYLGRLYQLKKDYKLARQTFSFLKKLSPEDASVIASLGEIEEKLGNSSKALKHFASAVELSPKNPKYLDFLISAAIEEKDLHLAQTMTDQLQTVNPENQKISVFLAQIGKLREDLMKKGE